MLRGAHTVTRRRVMSAAVECDDIWKMVPGAGSHREGSYQRVVTLTVHQTPLLSPDGPIDLGRPVVIPILGRCWDSDNGNASYVIVNGQLAAQIGRQDGDIETGARQSRCRLIDMRLDAAYYRICIRRDHGDARPFAHAL